MNQFQYKYANVFQKNLPRSPVFPWSSMSAILKAAMNYTASSLYLSKC